MKRRMRSLKRRRVEGSRYQGNPHVTQSLTAPYTACPGRLLCPCSSGSNQTRFHRRPVGHVPNLSVTGYRMPADSRPRRLVVAALTVALAALIAGCVQNPNSVFHNRTDFNRDVGSLFKLLIWLGTIVFVLTEAMLVWALWRYRSRPGKAHEPEQVHGNTRLEILWTVIPAVVLAVIAVPTVRTIFKTEAEAPAGALEVEVTGHQWWWEFRYPQYGVVTANELYLP